MKISNILLGLWMLLIAGLALLVVYFLRTGDEPTGPGRTGEPVTLPPVSAKETPREDGRDPQDKRAKPPAGGRSTAQSGTVTGRVTDAEGAPVAGATVRLHVPGRPASAPSTGDPEELKRILQIVPYDDEWGTLHPLATWMDADPASGARGVGAEVSAAQTGEDGKFSLRTPAGQPGPFQLAARSDAHGGASAANVFAGQDVEMVLTSGGVVTGTVVSKTNGGPVPQAHVVFDSGEKRYASVTDEAGAFRVDGMPPGRFSVRVGAKGFTPVLDRAIQVRRGEPVNLELPRGTTLRVKALAFDEPTDAGDEKVVAGAEVVAVEETAGVYVTGKTNDYGMVEFPGLPPGTWLVDGRADGYVSAGGLYVQVHEKDEVKDETVEFELAVDTPVLVTDESGLPLAGVEFYGYDAMEGYDVLKSSKLTGETDGQGLWKFPFEWEGPRQQAYAFKKGFGVALVLPEDNASGDQIRVVLKKAVRIHGAVTDAAGAAVPDALVRLTWEAAAEDVMGEPVVMLLRTNASGRYDFPFVPEGVEVLIEAESSDGDAWSDDAPSVETKAGVAEHAVDLRLEAEPPEPKVEFSGPRGESRPAPKGE